MSFRLKLATASILSAIALSACTSVPLGQTPAPQAAASGPSYPPVVNALVARTKSQVRMMKMADFRAALERKDTGVLVDVREPEEYADGHVPGAVNVPRGLAEFQIWKLVGFPAKTDTGAKITVYCRTGGRAALTAKALQDLGFTNVTAVDMQFADWVKSGAPVAKGE